MKTLKLMVNVVLLVAAVICGLSFIAPGAAVAADKPDFLHTAVIGDFSGPYAPIVGQTRPGTLDGWQYINSELGGVHGVKVKPIIKDMTGKVALGLSQYNEVINMNPKPKFVDIYITPLSEALRERYVEDDMVGIHAGAIVSLYPQANSYAMYALYPEQVGACLKWIRDTKWKEERNMKVGIITWDTSYGRAILVKPFYDYLKKIGVDLVGTQVFGIREVDLTTQLMKLRAKKPDYLATNCAAGGALAIKKGCKEMGWDITLVNAAGSDWGTARLDPPMFNGDIVALPTMSFDETDNPTVKKVMKYFNLNKRTIKDVSVFYLLGWQNALVQQKIMTDVVSKHGWKGLNTKNIIAGLNTLTNFKPLGGIANISYTAKRRTPPMVKICVLKDAKMIPQTDFFEVADMRPEQYK